MAEGTRHSSPTWPRASRGLVAFAMATSLLTACSGSSGGTDSVTQPTPSASRAPSPSATDRSATPTTKPTPTADPVARLPEVPSARDARALARQLDVSAATVRDRRARASDVRRAAEFHQLAVRAVAESSADFRRRVLARLDRGAAAATRSDVRASMRLQAMGSPVRELPRWRIVTPPPPDELLAHYRRAERRTGVPWNYLAAIHLVETRMGRIRGTSTAGAQGPMQFLPATWDLYGEGGDINDPGDAILAAGRLLRRHGAPEDMADALWHYNQSDNYVRAVSDYARVMEQSSAAYRGYWHWRVLYRHVRGTYVLPTGYPEQRPVRLP